MIDERTDLITNIKRKIHLFILKKSIRKKHITIISQNCIGGVIYNMLGMKFMSPTINLYINGEDFVKLIESPKYYFSITPKPFIENYVEPTNKKICFPLIKVGDLTIYCRHYRNCEDAIDAWNRRRKRIDFNNIYVIATSWNLLEKKALIKRVNDCKYPNVIFTYDKYIYSNCVHLKGNKWKKDERGFVKPALPNYSENGYIRNFEEQFDFVKWINTGNVREKEN